MNTPIVVSSAYFIPDICLSAFELLLVMIISIYDIAYTKYTYVSIVLSSSVVCYPI